MEGKSIEQKWDLFKNIYNELVDKYIPNKSVKCGQRSKPPWTRYTTVNRAKKAKRKAWVTAQKSGLKAHLSLFEQHQKNVKTVINEAKAHYEEKLVDHLHDDPKRFYNYTRNFCRSSSTVDAIKENGTTYTDDKEKANILNDFFISVMTSEPEGDINIPIPTRPIHTVHNITITRDKVITVMKKLKRNKACGVDGIHVNVLREVLSLSIPLTDIFQHSANTGHLPQDWKDANVTPLHKKGSRQAKQNFRPVSLTSQICKIMERLVLADLWGHINTNHLITCDQHGFQGSCSCTTQLIECLDDWTNAVDNGDNLDVIYLDFSKAFDNASLDRLLYKLDQLGVDDTARAWIKSFLLDRLQRVIIDGEAPTSVPVTSGVPQGSVLGPILFLAFINDLPDYVSHSQVRLFADDTILYLTVSSTEDCLTLQEDLHNLKRWERD